MLSKLSEIATRLDTIEQQTSKIEVIEERVKELSEIRGMVGELEKGQARISQSMETLSRRCDELSYTVEELKQKVDQLENQNRRNNLIMHGVAEKERETWSDTEDLVRENLRRVMGLSLADGDIERAHRLGRSGSGRRPIIIKFLSFKTKSLILGSGHLLRGTGVGISEDFSARVRGIRRQLIPIMKQAKADGRRASIRYDKLIIDGKEYRGHQVNGDEVYHDQSRKRRPSGEAVSSPLMKRSSEFYPMEPMVGMSMDVETGPTHGGGGVVTGVARATVSYAATGLGTAISGAVCDFEGRSRSVSYGAGGTASSVPSEVVSLSSIAGGCSRHPGSGVGLPAVVAAPYTHVSAARDSGRGGRGGRGRRGGGKGGADLLRRSNSAVGVRVRELEEREKRP